MEKKLLVLFAIALQTVLFGREVVVTEKNNGETIELDVHDTLQVNLAGNPTTGFVWEESSPASPILCPANHIYTPSGTLMGSGGVFSFMYQATSHGSAQLSFVYRRPWETDVSPLQTFSITVFVWHPRLNDR